MRTNKFLSFLKLRFKCRGGACRTANWRTTVRENVLFWKKGVLCCGVRARYLLGWVCSRFLQVGCWTRTERLIKIVARALRRYQLTVLGDKVVLSAARPIAARLTSRSFQTEEMRDVGEWVRERHTQRTHENAWKKHNKHWTFRTRLFWSHPTEIWISARSSVSRLKAKFLPNELLCFLQESWNSPNNNDNEPGAKIVNYYINFELHFRNS